MLYLSRANLKRGDVLKDLQILGNSSSPFLQFPFLSFNICSSIPTATVLGGTLKDPCCGASWHGFYLTSRGPFVFVASCLAE